MLSTLATRILANLDLIDGQAPTADSVDPDRPPFSDTQLLISLLGVLVFPHERTPNALGHLLSNYGSLDHVVAIKYPTGDANCVEIIGPDGARENIDPKSIRDLPRILRNSIAHFNVRPIDKNGRFGGIRVWNEDDEGRITLVADLDFDELRPLARHILTTLAQAKSDLELDDPADPLETLAARDDQNVETSRKAPRITEHVWRKILAGHNSDFDRAKTYVDRTLQSGVRALSTKAR
jgi:hypothetical protein